MTRKHGIWLALILTTLAQPSFAEDKKPEPVKTFEQKITDNWVVLGLSYPKRERNDVCFAYKEWKDGSQMEITKDLKDGELYIWHQTMSWNRINDEKKTYPIRMNFYDQKGAVIESGTADYKLINKNTIRVPAISEKKFLKALVNSNKILFVPEGNVGNIQVYFDGKSPEIAAALADCVRTATVASPPPAMSKRDNSIEPPSLDLPPRTSVRDTL